MTHTNTTTRCQCEHAMHFDTEEYGPRTGHVSLAVPAGTRRAMFVGEICDDCADTHMADYLVEPHPPTWPHYIDHPEDHR